MQKEEESVNNVDNSDVAQQAVQTLDLKQESSSMDSQTKQLHMFTDNMSFLALNAFEIYSLYEIISEETE